MEYSTLDQQLVKVVVALCDAVGTDVSRLVRKNVTEGRLKDLVSMTVDPAGYSCAKLFRKDYACVEFLRKCQLQIPGVNRKQKAIDNFWNAEHDCARTNVVFSRALHNSPKDLAEMRLFEKLEDARKWIARTLGPLPGDLAGRFGPGSTMNDKGKLTAIPDKMSSRPTVTSEAECLLAFWTDTAWYRALRDDNRSTLPMTVRGNRFTTVPKDALKDRGICIEPSINIFFQLSVGRILKARLLKAGLNLKDAQQVHRQWACQASRDGKHATIDLSNASDTVALRLVEWLIPSDWFTLLKCLRSPTTQIEGKSVHLQKFSSMGNGFTFELETLIFASICFAMGGGEVGTDFSVFGDDIIVKTECAAEVLAALRFCGFTPNGRKTFVTGKFRESCGGDFFDGIAVRPYHLEESPNEPQHWISMANGIRRLGHEDSVDHYRWSYSFTAWLRCLDALPSSIRRLRGPAELGDLVIHDNQYHRRWRHGIGYIRVYRPTMKVIPWYHWTGNVMFASCLYGVDSGSSRNDSTEAIRPGGVTPRGSVNGYKVGYVAFS